MFLHSGDLLLMTTSPDRRGAQPRESTHAWMKLLVASEKPVVMAVNGAAVGAGTSLALVGGVVVVASDRADFMPGFPRSACCRTAPCSITSPRAIRPRRRKDFLMTNRRIDAETAWG